MMLALYANGNLITRRRHPADLIAAAIDLGMAYYHYDADVDETELRWREGVEIMDTEALQ